MIGIRDLVPQTDLSVGVLMVLLRGLDCYAVPVTPLVSILTRENAYIIDGTLKNPL